MALERLRAPAPSVSGLAFTVTLRAPRRDTPWICAAALLAVGVDLVAAEILGSVAGVFVAAIVVGLAGNAFGRVLRRSPLIFIVPGVLLLVPGSAGFESTAQLLEGQTTSGVDAGFGIFMTTLAIVYGLVVARRSAAQRAREPPSRPRRRGPRGGERLIAAAAASGWGPRWSSRSPQTARLSPVRT